jgi:hypothetical protein
MVDNRQHIRVPGPFDGKRLGLLETPVRIYDLSEGGCFVTSLYDEKPGEQLTIKIQLPSVGWVTVEGETLYNRPDFGFAVRFTTVSEQARSALVSVIEALGKHALQSA